MKHFYASFMLLFAALFCSAQIVTERPEGTMKYYQRTGGLTYLTDGQQMHLQNQSGFTEIVYSADGTKAWVKNPVAAFFPEDSKECAWARGPSDQQRLDYRGADGSEDLLRGRAKRLC